VPVLASLRPLTSFEEAEYLAHEVHDVIIPPATLTALEQAGKSVPRVGIDLAVRTAAALREMVNGIVIAPSTDIVATAKQIMAA
jgi:methionine synthase / methylenetetrahydrofolate reductase(NADPH)